MQIKINKHMLKNPLHYLWSLRHQFAKYFIVGFFGVILDVLTLILFKEVFGWTPVIAVAINQILLIGYTFTLNKYWSFKNTEISHRQLLRFLWLVGCNYLFSVLWMWFWIKYMGFEYVYREIDSAYIIVRLVSIALMVSWNFFLYKYWVYGEEAKSL
ncbi:MAG: GtrA family protein [Candidatus Magasanikbacteria bacterium]|nr:GtrA family protein [Candidatus Magasanikbacteria bacterium]